MKVDHGELRHFCDDSVCPDPVWKLSKVGMDISVSKRLFPTKAVLWFERGLIIVGFTHGESLV